MNPFALINDTNKSVAKIILDTELENVEYMAFHPMDCSATVEIKKTDLDTFLDSLGRKMEVVSLVEPVEAVKTENE